MNEDHQKGMLCGLIAAGLRVEGLLRVALERPETREEIAPQVREAFELYSAIFRQAWPEAVPAETTVIEGCVSEGADMSDPSDESDRSDTSETPDETDAFDVPEEDCEPVAVAEEEPEAVPEVVIVEAEPDAPASDTKPLADTLKVDELIARKETADLRRAFTLNDKFRFRRTLFGGSDARFSEVLDALEGFRTYEQAERYLAGVIDMECEDAQDFLNIMESHFGGKQ